MFLNYLHDSECLWHNTVVERSKEFSLPSCETNIIMRKTILICLPILVALSFSLNPVPDPLSEGLIAHYSFNDCDARDDSGNGSDGVLFGSPQCRCGVEEDALWLDGTQDYIEFHGSVNDYFTTSDFTLSFYFKPAQYSIFKQSLLSKRSICDENFMFDIQFDKNASIVDTDVHEAPEKDYPEISPETDSTAWIHFALVREGIRATTYINGTPRRKGLRCSGIDLTNDALLSFANSICIRSGRTVRFKGAVDELRIYDRALTEDEMISLYSRAPVETAEIDCFTYLPKKTPKAFPKESESSYLCANF